MQSSITPKVLIYASEAQRIADYAWQYPCLETGGDLYGYWTHSGAPVVCCVLGPGPASRRSSTSFYQDSDYLEQVSAELYRRHALQHIGEWHSHHQLGLNQPSGGDLTTVRRGLESMQWQRFLLVVTTFAAADACVLQNYFLIHAGQAPPQPLLVNTLSGNSPVAAELDQLTGATCAGSAGVRWQPGPATPLPAADVRRRHADAWFATASGQQLLRQIIQALGVYGKPRMLTANNRLTVQCPDFSVEFPEAFPREPLNLCSSSSSGGSNYSRRLYWQGLQQLLTTIRAFRRYAALRQDWQLPRRHSVKGAIASGNQRISRLYRPYKPYGK